MRIELNETWSTTVGGEVAAGEVQRVDAVSAQRVGMEVARLQADGDDLAIYELEIRTVAGAIVSTSVELFRGGEPWPLPAATDDRIAWLSNLPPVCIHRAFAACLGNAAAAHDPTGDPEESDAVPTPPSTTGDPSGN